MQFSSIWWSALCIWIIFVEKDGDAISDNFQDNDDDNDYDSDKDATY